MDSNLIYVGLRVEVDLRQTALAAVLLIVVLVASGCGPKRHNDDPFYAMKTFGYGESFQGGMAPSIWQFHPAPPPGSDVGLPVGVDDLALGMTQSAVDEIVGFSPAFGCMRQGAAWECKTTTSRSGEAGEVPFDELVFTRYIFRCGTGDSLEDCLLTRVHWNFSKKLYDQHVAEATTRYGEPLISEDRARPQPDGSVIVSEEHIWLDENGFLLAESIGPTWETSVITIGTSAEMSPIMKQMLRERGLD